jgi:hypothetical protein
VATRRCCCSPTPPCSTTTRASASRPGGRSFSPPRTITREPFDLRAQLPRLIDQPIRRIEFGFTPERWWPEATVAGEDTEAHLFVRGLPLSREPHRFPVLAHT